ncbi:hypothetical protein, partial [Calothrix sp. UHCC 0171]|uniref:glycosyltransferase n=1 Tax=Calothrix sp. UHCC 0171 TaxID=3110245 RepID=UPI002B20B89F
KIPIKNPTETVTALAQAVEYMYENSEERLAMGISGYSFAKSQTWKQVALKISTYYDEIMMSIKPVTSKKVQHSQFESSI